MALDQITKALVDEFLSESGMPSAGVATDFERFGAYVVTSPHIDAAIDYENVMTGSGGDTGLDAIAMIVNGALVTDPDEIDALASSGATLDVNYIFLQAETSTSFSTSKIGQIAYDVKDFFADPPTLTRKRGCECSSRGIPAHPFERTLISERQPVMFSLLRHRRALGCGP